MSTNKRPFLSIKSLMQDAMMVRQLRFGVGVSASAAIAYAINWPLAFLFPIFTTLLLSMPLGQMTPKQLLMALFNTVKGFCFGLLFSVVLIKFPVIFLLLMFVSLFYIYYYLNRGGSFWLTLMLMLSILILPMLNTMSEGLAIGFSLGFVGSAWAAIVFVFVMYYVVPDTEKVNFPPAKPFSHTYSPIAAQFALKSTLVAFPIVAFCITYARADLLLTMIFAAMFTLKPELSAGKEAGRNSLISTVLGGAIAFVFYWALVAVPLFQFFIILMFGIALYMGMNIFSSNPTGKYYGSAMTCVIVLINGNMGADSDFISALVSRILFISLAILYIVVTLRILDAFIFNKKSPTKTH
ncbi:hypothetical protein A9264_02255 [Vibrio sp. UCD-FRSSP16_10]|uniref:DUF2955 domain-containing protein n=1 Tax=unclassified Vibrio TaxID=2614977 RepID=UPI000800E158|nr:MULTISPECIES: DUF2955 domain-containing protein [unclassified Vibrio]OBT13983.1 hypothetical protein A9260_03705 [Vibrio sp. UCD-FRSSP16_30]OBT22864.1 hypothetical protein A9264_02255 [Vibrio sp. UCD-FRSSP16_10]